MRKLALLGGLVACVILALTGVAWVSSQADSTVRGLQEAVRARTGRALSVSGGAHVSLWPRIELVLAGAGLSGSGPTPLVIADEVRLEVPWYGVFSAAPEPLTLNLVNPRFNFAIDNQGRASWVGKTWAGPALPVTIDNGSLAFLDERSGQALAVREIQGILTPSAAEGLAFKGHGVWNRQRFAIDAYVQSIPRLMQDGSPADIAFRAPSVAMTFSGRLAFAKGLALAGQASAEIEDLRALLAWGGKPLAGSGGLRAVSLAGALDVSGSALSFETANLAIDGMTAKGRIGFDGSGAGPSFTARLAAERLDLAPYGPGEPLNFAGLRDFDAALDISARSIVYGSYRTGPARLTVTVKDGVLAADLPSAAFRGGTVAAHAALDGRRDTPAAKLTLAADGIAAQPLFTEVAGLAAIDGAASLRLSLDAVGDGFAEMAAALNGSGHVAMTRGVLRGLDPAAAIRAISQGITEGWPKGAKAETSFSSLSASFGISDGIVTASRFDIAAPSYSILAKGEADLPRRAIDLSIEPKLVTGDGRLAVLPVAIRAKGPWSAPRLYPDMPGILEDPEAAYAALRKLGLPDVLPEAAR